VADRRASGDVAPEFLLVHLPASLAVDLATLTDALDDPDENLTRAVQRLASDAAAAVPSFAGLSLSTTLAGETFVFTALDDRVGPGAIAASLQLIVSSQSHAAVRSGVSVTIVLYALAPGALVDLAADVVWLCIDERVVLDEHLVPPEAGSTSARLGELSLLNRAIGVLVDRGRTLEQAHRQLDLATEGGAAGRNAAVAAVLAGLDEPAR
jgi:hypothetical protein